MDKLPKCYAAYGTGECELCQYSEWCISAADPQTFDESSRFREYAMNFEGWDAIEEKIVNEGSNLSKLLGELIVELEEDRAELLWEFLASMSALSREYPSIYRVVRLRILYPNETYQQIADMLGVTRQNVEQLLSKGVELIPTLKAAFPVPRLRERQQSDDAFSIRCSGGCISVLAEGVSIVLRMPMDEMNSGNIRTIIEGLNGMHWKKKVNMLGGLK